MRRDRIRGRLALLAVGATALIALAACGPSANTASPTSTPAAPDASVAAITEPQASPVPAAIMDKAEGDLTAPDQDPKAASMAATPEAAEDTVRRYYEAINDKDYPLAYAQWGNDGAASRQSYEVFSKGYGKTASVQAQVGKAFDQEGAAGSRYIRVPVELAAAQTDGSVRHYRGSFTLRAVMADGATPEQRRWHLDSAELEGFEPDAVASAAPSKDASQ